MDITRISRLRDYGVFRDFTWPADLPGFGRYNLIYGWNASGKTLLSRVFAGLQRGSPPDCDDILLELSGGDRIRREDFEMARHQVAVRVFNRDFVTESVFPVDGGDVSPIFVVGKESVEKQKEVEQLKRKLADAQTTLDSGRSKKQNAESALDKHCIDRATLIRETLRSSGSNPYNNYDKSYFRDRAQKMAANGDKEAHQLSASDRERLFAQHGADLKLKIYEVSYEPPNLAALTETVAQLLKTTVVSGAIQSLKDDPTLSSWVHHGLGLHQGRSSERCLFCEQPLPGSRLAELEAHFNIEYEQFLVSLDAQIATLAASSKTADTLVPPNRAELYQDLVADYDAAAASLLAARDSTKKYLDSLVQALTDKKDRAFESLDFNVTVPDADSGAADRLSRIIRKHNQACDDFQTRVTDARKRLEANSIADALDEFVRLRDAISKFETLIEEATTQVKPLNHEIQRLEGEIVDHRQPAEELNRDLRNYLGHDELSLETEETGYAITRNGISAQALSEGETTAIALLYFLKSLQDRRFELAHGVVVLDDPVSSLDSNALYLAFGFIRERTQQAGQLFILTHNFTFFRQVRNWFHHLKGQNKKDVSQRPARFYMLDCAFDGEQRCSSIRPLDPLLEQYDSEYHYLFARIYRETKALPRVALEESYIFPNMARRLLEAFLAFRQPQVSGELWHKFKEVKFDEAKKLRILRFLHTHSHSDVIGEPDHDPSLLGEARAVLTDLLELIKDQDPAHYAAMVELVDQPDEEGAVR